MKLELKNLKTQSERTRIAENAIIILKHGIEMENKSMILDAYKVVEAYAFSWNDLDLLFSEWEDLLDEANDLLLI